MWIAFKNLWRYLKNYKGLLVTTVITIVIAQALLLVAPLLVRELLDNHISGVEQPFVQVQKQDNKTVQFEGDYYKQVRNLTPRDVKLEKTLQVIASTQGFYVVRSTVEAGQREFNTEKNILTVQRDNQQYTYSLIPLESQQVTDFFRPSFRPMMIIIGLIFLRAVLSIIFGYIQRMATAYITVYITRDARMDAVASLHKMSVAELQAEPAGKLSARVVHDVSGLMTLFSVMINIFFNATIGLVFTYIGMFYLNPVLAAFTFLVFPIIYFWLRIFAKNIYKVASRAAEINSLLIANMNEIINGISILQIFNQKETSRNKFNVLSQEFVGEQMKEVKFHLGMGWNLIRFFKSILTIAILFYFGWLQLGPLGGIVLAGTVYAYLDYLNRMLDPLDLLFIEFGNLQHALVKTERVFKLINMDSEVIEKNYCPRFKGDIEFRNVSFAYGEEQDAPYVLKDINLSIEAGQMIGLVGHTGSGKSSMMNLLMRFYDVKENDKGTIYIDGENITHLTKQTYRQHVGIILQEPTLFSGTLADNIRFGKEGVLDREIEELFKRVGGQRILDKFENGLQQEINRSGSNLSVGEQQIIAFARALVHNPAVLIMDEATANMDTETEKMIQEALEVVSQERTTIVIAHRLSTIRDADNIIVLENGEIKETGTHKKLLKHDGIYANMYRSQS